MSKTLLGRTIYLFVGTFVCTTTLLCGVVAIGDYLSAKEESKNRKENDDEMDNLAGQSDG